jgi:uncharacterized coiled-coil protein SlyX
MGEKHILEQRLNQLKAEFEAGQKSLAELEARQASIQLTMDRIRDAMRELEQEIANADQTPLESDNRKTDLPGTPGVPLKRKSRSS